MDSRVFVPGVLLLFGFLTVFAQSNSPDQGRGLLIRVLRV